MRPRIYVPLMFLVQMACGETPDYEAQDSDVEVESGVSDASTMDAENSPADAQTPEQRYIVEITPENPTPLDNLTCAAYEWNADTGEYQPIPFNPDDIEGSMVLSMLRTRDGREESLGSYCVPGTLEDPLSRIVASELTQSGDLFQCLLFGPDLFEDICHHSAREYLGVDLIVIDETTSGL